MDRLIKDISILGIVLLMVISFVGCEKTVADGSMQMKLFSAVPEVASPNQKVILYGSNIGTGVIVKIGGVACAVDSVSDVRISFTVPVDCIGGALEVVSSKGRYTLKDFFVNTGVLITSFYPQNITSNEILVIKGSGFDANNAFKNVVSVVEDNDVEIFPFTVLRVTSDSIVVKATADFTKGYIKVSSSNHMNKSVNKITFIRMIRVNSFSPNRGGAGTLVTFKGENFTPGAESEISVSCGGKSFSNISIIDKNTLTARVPSDLNMVDTIKIASVNTGNALCNSAFRYDYATEVDFGGYGVLYDSQTIPVTQAKVDSLLNMGVTYVTLSLPCTITDGFETGTLPTDKNSLDNIVRLKQMSGDKLKTVLIIQHNKTFTAGYANVTPTTIASLFDNIKNYSYNGKSAWDCVDAFQVLYSSGSALATTAVGVKDYVDKFLKPTYVLFHPSGFAKRGEKLIIGLQSVAANNNSFLEVKAMQDANYFSNVDVLTFMWNLSLADISKDFYSRVVPVDAFEVRWLSQMELVVKAADVSFLCELNLNAATAPYAKVDDLGNAMVSVSRKMKAYQTYRGFSYAKFHANEYGIRSATDALDNRSGANKITPTASHYQMYKNVVSALK